VVPPPPLDARVLTAAVVGNEHVAGGDWFAAHITSITNELTT
jgi:hypothetical protein